MELLSLLLLLLPLAAAKLKTSSEELDGDLPPLRPTQRSSRSRTPPPMEIANCPTSCSCNTSNIYCINTDYDGSTVFMQMQPLAFPSLDTIVMSGNRLADLSGQPLFGVNRIHEKLTLVNLTDNRITSISTDTFIGMPNLEFLYLRKNQISSSSRNPFGALVRLQGLDLSSALRDKGRSIEFVHSLFDSRRSLMKLLDVDLSNNGLTALNASTFCKLPALARLHLSGNSLTNFSVRAGGSCLSALHHLDLSGNQIRSLPSSLWTILPSLSAVDLSSNPLHCDCLLKPLVELAQQDSNNFLNQGKTQCASPPSLAGENVFSLEVSRLCSSSPATSSSFLGHLFLLAIIAAVAFTLYRFYRHRIPSPPAFQFGYSSLKERDEPEPHFV